MRAEGFFCNLDILYGGLGIGKLLFDQNFFFPAVIFVQFLVTKALDLDWIRISIQPKMLDPDPDEMNADPQPWFEPLVFRTGTMRRHIPYSFFSIRILLNVTRKPLSGIESGCGLFCKIQQRIQT